MKTNIVNIKDINISDIIALLNTKSSVIAIPTDTVYALCCNAYDRDAVNKIYDLKKRDKGKPISLFIKSIEELEKYIKISDYTNISNIIDINEYKYKTDSCSDKADRCSCEVDGCSCDTVGCRGEASRAQIGITKFLKKYWPGALTVIFKKKDDIFDYLTSGNDTIGIRIPNDKLLLDILNKVDFPIAQTSCNLSNEEELKNAKEIYDKFGDKINLIVEFNVDIKRKASTIISLENDNIKILRQGDIIV